MLDDFFARAILAGLGTALAAGPLGCFVVWRRMAYFGDATAHGSLLGVALALGFALPVFWGVLAVALVMAVAVARLAGPRAQGADTVLGVLAHSALAFGLVVASLLPGLRVDLTAYLFGDILAVSRTDLGFIWGGALAVAGLIAWRWNSLLTATLDEDLAQAAGVNPARERLVLTLAMALAVAAAIKTVGALLIAAMLIVPAAAARGFSRTPEAMALVAVLLGAVSAMGGLWASLVFDTPAGPSIVAVAALLYAGSLAARAVRPA